MTTNAPPTRRPHLAVVLLGPVGVWATLVLLAAGAASGDRINEGCWGPCAASQREGVVLVGGLLGVIAVPAGMILVGLASALSTESDKLHNAVVALVVFGVLAATGLVLLVPELAG